MPQEFTHRGIPIRTFDVPCTPFVWVHEETDGHGTAETLKEARDQIDRHLSALAHSGA
jgi:hypothetical protein